MVKLELFRTFQIVQGFRERERYFKVKIKKYLCINIINASNLKNPTIIKCD